MSATRAPHPVSSWILASTDRVPFSRRGRVWLVVAAAFSLVGWWISVRVSTPGRLEFDALYVYEQVIGRRPMDDWHPPVFTALWQLLLRATGDPAALLWLQLGVGWLTGFGMAVLLYDLSRRIWVSSLGLLFMALPYIANFAGVLVKDTHMMLGFLGACVAVLLAARFPRLRWPLLLLAFVLLVYGTAVRKNAFFAVAPVVWMMYAVASSRTSGARRSLVRRIIGFVVLLVVTGATVVGLGKAVDTANRPIHQSQVTQVMLDDIVFVLPEGVIKNADISPRLRDTILTARAKCLKDKTIWNVYWRCYGTGANGRYTAIADADQVTDLWLAEVPTRPLGYLRYRTMTFVRFLSGTGVQSVDGTLLDVRKAGMQPSDPQSASMLNDYVSWGLKNFRVTFQSWFWFALSIGLPFLARRWHCRTAVPITCLALSALAYLLGYFPTIPAAHYRYVYWPAAACTLAVFLMVADRVSTAGRRRLRKFALRDVARP